MRTALTRLPKHLRDRAVWEEDLTIQPLGADGRTHFRKLHTPGFEGWTNSAYPHFDGSPNTGQPDRVLDDMDSEGVWVQDLTDDLVVDRIVFATTQQSLAPQHIIASLVGGGVTERFPDLHFVLVEFNANWLVSFLAAMDKAWTLGIGQDRDFWVGVWDDDRAPDDQPGMAQVFRLNERWPYPLRPSEYVRRQIHVSFQEDPIALACRHITGRSTLVWGVDYPYPEGTFRRTREAIAHQFRDVDPTDRAAILGGTTATIFGLDTPVAV